MPTGACGVNCDVCYLNRIDVCSSCGPGISHEAAAKIEAQKRLFGHPCPVLACAQMNGVAYCLKDCLNFPCENFKTGPYPYSDGFLQMQERRRKQKPPAKTPSGENLEVPPLFWDDLRNINLNDFMQQCPSKTPSIGRDHIALFKYSIMGRYRE